MSLRKAGRGNSPAQSRQCLPKNECPPPVLLKPTMYPPSLAQHREGVGVQMALKSLVMPLVSGVTQLNHFLGASVSPSVKQESPWGLPHWVRILSMGSAARQRATSLLGQLVLLPIGCPPLQGQWITEP